MRSRLLTLVALGLLAYFLFRFAEEQDRASQPLPSGGALFPGLEIQDVGFLSLKFRTGHILDLERDSQGPWMITAPTDELAQKEYAEVVVRNLASAMVLPIEEQGGAINPEDVGLGRHAKSITFGRGEHRRTLFVGDRNPLGPGVFAQLEGSPHVVMVTENLDNMLEQFRAQDYVDKHLLRGLTGNIRRVRVEFPEGVLIDARLDGDAWNLTEPIPAQADNSRLSTLVRSLRFVEQIYPIETTVVDSQLRELGLPTADQIQKGDWANSTMIQLTGAAQTPARVFLQEGWNKTPDAEILAVREDLRKILVIDRRELNLLLNTTDFFRDRRVTPPIRDRARRVRIAEGDTTLLDVRQNDQGLWTYREPKRLEGVALDSERVDGFSLVAEFLGKLDQLSVEAFTDPADEETQIQDQEPAASVRIDWSWANRENQLVLSLYDLEGESLRARVSERPKEGLLLGPDVLSLLDPQLPDLLRHLRPLELPESAWGGLEIHIPSQLLPLSVSRPDTATPWQGDDTWGRRFGLGHDLLRGFRGLAWQPLEAGGFQPADYDWRVVFLGFDGAALGTLSFRGLRPGEPQEVQGQAAAVAHWSGVPNMELLVSASILDRMAALGSPQLRGG